VLKRAAASQTGETQTDPSTAAQIDPAV